MLVFLQQSALGICAKREFACTATFGVVIEMSKCLVVLYIVIYLAKFMLLLNA